MSIQAAMNFIQKVGEDTHLKDTIGRLGDSDNLEAVVRIGVETGFEFTVKELKVAFSKDWEIRRYFYKTKAIQ